MLHIARTIKTQETMINGVVFKRSWRDKALSLLPADGARLSFYEALFSLAFDGQDEAPADAAARIMYEMCKDDIAAEISRYQKVCERNAANAAARYTKSTSGYQSQPVAASGSDGNQSQSNSNNKGNSNNKSNGNLSSAEAALSVEREKWEVYGVFFRRGSIDPRAEAERFWNYYDALGWKNNKGAPISNKNSAAAMWSIEGEPAPDTALRQLWWRHFHLVGGVQWALWSGIERFEIERTEDTATVLIYCAKGGHVRTIVEAQYVSILANFVRDCMANSVEYRMRQ